MATLRSLLTLYGALDLAVMQATDPGVAETVNQYLPNASAHPGWSDEIEAFFFAEQPRNTDVEQSVGDALTDIARGADGEPSITIPELSRLVYVLGALAHVDAAKSRTENFDPFVDALMLAGPPDKAEDAKRSDAVKLLDRLTTSFPRWQEWEEVTRAAVRENLLLADISDVPLCFPAVVTVDGLPCVLIDAELTSKTVTLNNLKDVVDALNWPKAYPSFFCSMKDLGLRGDKWRNVLETAGFCYVNPSYKLHTVLKYIKSEHTLLDARLDYDLAENQKQNGGDEKVLVDRGYINMRCTNTYKDPSRGGVWVRTRKLAHVVDLSPYAQAKLLCISGYAYAAAEMLFGPAAGKHKDYVEWDDEPLKNTGDLEKEMDEPASASAATPPAEPKLDATTKTAEALKESANFLTAKHLELLQKWLAGQLTFAELAKISQEVGGRVASDPWKLLQELTKPTP